MIRGRLIVACIASLYILAAIRAIVPGICLTQRAALETIRQHRSCCNEAPASPEGAMTLQSPRPPHPPCPLCQLATAPRETLAIASLPFAVARFEIIAPAPPSRLHLPLFPVSDPGRSPPA